MKIVVDENIPLADALFGDLGEIIRKPGREISSADVAQADALLVRSVTRVNADLLKGSTVKFVGTCTIGTDHLDKEFLAEAGIRFASAPGCNAQGVVQYDLAAFAHLGYLDRDIRVGIIGCGNVGGSLHRALTGMGVNCVCYDPFLTQDQNADLADWEALFTCDVICVHTPLTRTGPHPTHHMLSTPFFRALRDGVLLLNAGRGEVIDNNALKAYLQGENSNHLSVVLDVWEGEPAIDAELAPLVQIATPHIAGYSFEGKTNGSLMIYEALAEFLGINAAERSARVAAVKAQAYGAAEPLDADDLVTAILATHPITRDDKALRDQLGQLPAGFDALRKGYPVRREFSHYRLTSPQIPVNVAALGFSLDRAK